MYAQTGAAPSGDVTIALTKGNSEYCLGPTPVQWANLFKLGQGPDDIALRLPLKLRYENHRSDTILLPMGLTAVTRMTVTGETEPTILRNTGRFGPADWDKLTALSSPDADHFSTVASSKGTVKLSVLKYPDSVDVDDFVAIPVWVRSSGFDLRGKTVQITTTRDFRSIAPEVVDKLNEKWKNYGTVWAKVVESDTLTLRIPEAPMTVNCMTPSPSPR
jgi:hypothetical protein